MSELDMNAKDNFELDEILEELLEEESRPDHETLLRWCQRYPQHKDALSRFFATWAVQTGLVEEPQIDADLAASRMVSHALNLLHKRSPVAATNPGQ